eukprot:3421684-Rhodomonas_salina.1
MASVDPPGDAYESNCSRSPSPILLPATAAGSFSATPAFARKGTPLAIKRLPGPPPQPPGEPRAWCHGLVQ